jgi:hypothetical protein
MVTIDRQKYLDVITKANLAQGASADLDLVTIAADPNNGFEETFDDIHNSIEVVKIWANQKILEAEQEQVMTSFLSELKIVFDKYSASSAITPFETGYGIDWGEPGLGYVLTASLDGVSSTKEIKKSVINLGDLV